MIDMINAPHTPDLPNAPALPHAATPPADQQPANTHNAQHTANAYVELHLASAFSFFRGASSPEALAAWARRGEQAVVVVRWAATGELALLVRERSRQDDCLVFVEALGHLRPQAPKLLVWDNAPPHHPKQVQAAATAAHITIAWFPFRAPELMPSDDLWWQTKALVAANQVYDPVQQLAERAVSWLEALPPFERLRQSGLLSATFEWLAT